MTGNRLVGRDAELSQLLALLDTAAAGQPVVTLISGDAGVGKTRLVTELAARARDRGFTVLSGRCAELGDAVPYLPLADALRDATNRPSPGGALLDALAARPVLSRLLPDRDDSQPACGDLPGLVQQQLFGAVLGLLTELAGAAPGAAGTRRPALGRPVHPRPGHLPQPDAAQRASRPRGYLPQRRPAPAASAPAADRRAAAAARRDLDRARAAQLVGDGDAAVRPVAPSRSRRGRSSR